MNAAVRVPGIQTASLFLLDGLANATDFAFHFWMGRVLVPSDFAILQTLNSVMLVYTTASGVFQPVVARFVAEARGQGRHFAIPSIFQLFLRAAFWLGAALTILAWLFSASLARLLNLPAWAVQASVVILLLSSLRPIAAGALQGQENFMAFGFARLALSLGRVFFAFLLVRAGLGLTSAVLALPFGWFASVLCAALLLGRSAWQRQAAAPPGLLEQGWKLSAYALLAYLAYMSLTSLDLISVNQNLPGELAGAYAGLVLMRRIVALLPGVAVTVMFPRVVRALAERRLPDRLIARTAGIILAVGGVLSLLYFMFDESLIRLIFGERYLAAAPLLGWMGVAMIGIALGSVWLNFYLAYEQRGFVTLLGVTVLLQWFLLGMSPDSMSNAVFAFGVAGWFLTTGGLLLYLLRARPALVRKNA